MRNLKRFGCLLLVLCLVLSIATVAFAGTGWLCTCGGTSVYYLYDQYDDSEHVTGKYCSSCDELKVDVYWEGHSFSGSTCTKCGYTRATTHTHTWVTTSSGCLYTVRCSGCGDISTSYYRHSYSYGTWGSYDDTQHCRSYSCSVCGDGPYLDYADHSLTTSYSQHDSATHAVTQSCSVCGYSSTTYEQHSDGDGDDKCDACGYGLSSFSVTVPATLPLAMAENGEVYAANVSIVNNSTAAVKVSGITVTAQNGWTLVPYATNMARVKVNAKQVGFSLNGVGTTATGSTQSITISGNWTIAKGGSLALDYDAVISATAVAVTNEAILVVVFVLDWA